MSQPTADTIDDILYCARYGELDELKDANFPAEYFKAADESGNTALHMACANGHLDIVKYVVEKLASLDNVTQYINSQNEQGNAPLHWAALNGHLEIVQLLIKNKAGRSPIYEAQAYNHEKVAEYFLSTMVEDEEGETSEEVQDVVEQGPSSGSGTSRVA
ncbi:ankyrin repeat-containing domain protein [Umbelopsis sp. PMI_123]|nr:ankyrin repeat-containing domain protein [Umbelopsis sp. PMI_123]